MFPDPWGPLVASANIHLLPDGAVALRLRNPSNASQELHRGFYRFALLLC